MEVTCEYVDCGVKKTDTTMGESIKLLKYHERAVHPRTEGGQEGGGSNRKMMERPLISEEVTESISK